MRKVGLSALFLLSLPAWAGPVTWGPASVSDNNGGAFLAGISTSATGAVYDLFLPNFSQNNFASPSPGEFDLAITATSTVPITGVSIVYSGVFTGPGSAEYTQTASAQSQSGTFSTSPTAVTFALPNVSTVNLATILQLFDNGGGASITKVEITASLGASTVPEPSSFAMAAFGAAVFLLIFLLRRVNASTLTAIVVCAVLSAPAWSQPPVPEAKKKSEPEDPHLQMTSMGNLAWRVSQQLAKSGVQLKSGRITRKRTASDLIEPPKPDICDKSDEDCDATGFNGDGPGSTQSEMAIAVDATGQHIVVGFNDFRGFAKSPTTVSGFAYSDDGGATFTDGGQLPNVTNGSIGSTAFPQVFGDPDVKYVPGGSGCQFIYSSIFVKGIGGTGTTFAGAAQTMSIHRSTDCGHTWAGPFEIPAATNPHGLLSGGNAVDASDKEFIDVDPDTGRVLMSWSNFTTGKIEIRATYSDNVMSATPPTWSSGVVIAAGNFTGSVPRFAGNGSNNVYVAFSDSNTHIAFSRSVDNGVTWGVPFDINTAAYISPDYIIGSDRIHSFPTMAVDNSPGINKGNIYVAAATDNNGDGSDVTLWRSTDGGLTFAPGILMDVRPGNDRAQWFPALAVDTTTGRVNLMYDDQQVAGSGDLMEMTWTYSDNGGTTWVQPAPLTQRPFHANYGNDSSQPNIGDYNMGVAQNGTFYAAYPTTPNLALFTDVQTPFGSFPYPSFLPVPNPPGFAKATALKAALNLGTVTFTDSGGNGFADAGDQLRYKLPLMNAITNPGVGALTYTTISATLSTSTPGVTVLAPTRSYPNIGPGAMGTNISDFVVQVSPGFKPGTRIDFTLFVTTGQATATLQFTQNTGTPVNTTQFSENFDNVPPGALPAGWATIHAGGANTVPWTTRSGFCGVASNALYHQELEDGPTTGTSAGDATRFERVATPNIAIPASDYVTLDFDICYNTEDYAQYSPIYKVLAFDGAHLRITDFTAGHAAIAVWAEAFAQMFTTGNMQSYPKHAPRSGNPNYFQDIPMWAGNSNGFQHVNMRLDGMSGTVFQLRPDYTQDSNGICAAGGANCGVAIDNIVLRSVVLKSDELSSITLRPVAGQPGVYTGFVMSQPIAPAGGIVVNLSSSNPGQTTLPSSVTIPAGSRTSPPFDVTVTVVGSLVTVTAIGPSNSRSAGVLVTP